LRFALLLLAPTGLWAAYHYWAAIRGFRADEARAADLVQAAAGAAPGAAQTDLATP
jgi:hypothetical protein